MVDFKTVPEQGAQALLVKADVGGVVVGGDGFLTLEGWLFVALAGMFLSIVMIVVTLLRSFFRARRERLAKSEAGAGTP